MYALHRTTSGLRKSIGANEVLVKESGSRLTVCIELLYVLSFAASWQASAYI